MKSGDILSGYVPLFVAGLWMTLKLTFVAITAGLALGLLLGLVSSSRTAPPPKSVLGRALLKPAQWITIGYVAFFRGTPLFVQILLVHFALMPTLIHPDHGLLLCKPRCRSDRSTARSSPGPSGLHAQCRGARTSRRPSAPASSRSMWARPRAAYSLV